MSSTSLDGNHALRACARCTGTGSSRRLVLDPLTARLAELAGFRAGYLGGGALGFAALLHGGEPVGLTQMVQAGRRHPCARVGCR